MATIHITDLLLRTIIGTNDWEREKPQDIILNIAIDYDAAKAGRTDNIRDTVDYKALTKRIIQAVEKSRFFLIEKLGAMVLDIILDIKNVKSATVRIDKPNALRFARSVSVTLTKNKRK